MPSDFGLGFPARRPEARLWEAAFRRGVPSSPRTLALWPALRRSRKRSATIFGGYKCSIFNWEANTASPEIRHMPATIQFLGHNPLPPANGWGERLVRHRTSLGLSQKKSARRLRVDPSTLA